MSDAPRAYCQKCPPVHPVGYLGKSDAAVPVFMPHHDSRLYLKQRGFTLIELIVVVTLLSLMLFFTFPRLSNFLSSDSRGEVSRWILAKAISLRTRAVETQQPHLMVVNIDANELTAMPEKTENVSDVGPSEGEAWEAGEAELNAAEEAASPSATYRFSGNMRLIDVAFTESDIVRTGSGTIHFHPKGYSDRAVIHLEDGDKQVSYYFAPFLSEVKIFDGYWMFE